MPYFCIYKQTLMNYKNFSFFMSKLACENAFGAPIFFL